MRDSASGIGAYNVALFGANNDSEETNKKFAESLELKFPLLCDSDGKAARAFGVRGLLGFSKRWTVYIGIDGKVKAIDKKVSARKHGKEVEARLAELDFPKKKTPPEDKKPSSN